MTNISSFNQSTANARQRTSRVQAIARVHALRTKGAEAEQSKKEKQRDTHQEAEIPVTPLRRAHGYGRGNTAAPDYVTSAFATQVIGQIMTALDGEPAQNAGHAGEQYRKGQQSVNERLMPLSLSA